MYVLFIDFRKAYDSINHELLWEKLLDRGYSTSTIALIKRIYKAVNFNGEYFQVEDACKGV